MVIFIFYMLLLEAKCMTTSYNPCLRWEVVLISVHCSSVRGGLQAVICTFISALLTTHKPQLLEGNNGTEYLNFYQTFFKWSPGKSAFFQTPNIYNVSWDTYK